MLCELKQTNKKLRETLYDLKSESHRQSGKKGCYFSPPRMLDASVGCAKSPSSRRGANFSDCGSIPPPCSGRSMLLSDRAKYIRGEATKRIDNLFHDWKDFKSRTDEELRKRLRSEQNLKEMVTRKDRELSDMSREICSLKTSLNDQKKIIDQMNQELDSEEKCRNRCTELELQIEKLNRHINELNDELEVESKCRSRCADLELQIGKLNRHVSDLNNEIRVRDEMLRSTEAEKESLSGINTDLRERNTDQKRKIEMCEHDVNETRMELEILEEMVRALNDRKLNIFSAARGHLDRPLTPGMERIPPGYDYAHAMAMQRHATTPMSSGFYPQEAVQHSPAQQLPMTEEDRDREMAKRLSAVSTAKSLKKYTLDGFEDLEGKIQKLKDENFMMKETTIPELKKSANMQ